MYVLFWQMEINFILFLQGLGNWLIPVMQFFTFLGSEYTYLILLPLIYWCVDSALGLRTGVMLMLSVSSNGILKMLLHTPRPYWVDARVRALASETSFGLPSGHSTNAAAIWGTVARGIKKRWFSILMIFIMFMIGLSRIFLGVHFIQDVLTGWLLGGLLVAGLAWLDKPISRWISSKTFFFQSLFCAGISLAVILLGVLAKQISYSFSMPQSWSAQAFASSGVYPDPLSLEGLVTISSVFLGFSIGYAWLVKKYPGYKVEGAFSKRVLRFLVGLVTVFLIYLPLKLIAPIEPIWWSFVIRFLRYALLGLWVSAGAPWLFRKLHLEQ